MAVSYMYHSGQADLRRQRRHGASFNAGTWHTVTQCYVMNTIGRSNGSLTGVDGRPPGGQRPDVRLPHPQ